MRKVGWQEFDELSERLYSKINGEKFDCILAVNRGGLLLGRLMSDYMELPLAVISAKAYHKGEEKMLKNVTLSSKISSLEDIAGKILLVDDKVESGSTVEAIKKYLAGLPKVQDVKIMVMFKTDKTREQPDFYAEKENDWVKFPYEKKEFNRT